MKKQISKWQKYRLKDLDAYRKRKREYAKTPNQRKKRAEYMRKWRKKNHVLKPKKPKRDSKDGHYIKRYGITFAEKKNMILQQENKCLICDKEFINDRHIHIDHDHKTNKIRGILCYSCNSKLGWFEKYDKKVIEYLK